MVAGARIHVRMEEMHTLTECTACARMTVRTWRPGDAECETWCCGGCDAAVTVQPVYVIASLVNERGERVA